jgi:hypothetical protein
MPDNSTILSLPLILPAQAQKHVTHNEALRILDVAVQAAVSNRNLTAPPLGPVVGQRHIIAAGASGEWAAKAGQIALFADGYWSYFAPQKGWRVWIEAEDAVATFDGAAWKTQAEGALTVARLGVAATPDVTNRLAVSAPATLLTHAGAGHQLKLNKASAGDTASLLFQTGFAGRAEMGTIGADAFGIKVSADGETFFDALAVAGASGIVSLPQGVAAAGFSLRDAGDPAKRGAFSVADLTAGALRTYTLPDVSSELAVLAGAQSFSGAKTFAGAVTVSAASADFGTASGAANYGLGVGATAAAATKTVNLGTGGVAGSTTVVKVGSGVAGAEGSLVVNLPTVTFANTVTAVGMTEAAVVAKYLGLGGASGDATNRLSVNSPAVLLNNAGAGIETTLNKAAMGDDASIAFKTGFSARALVGLLGSDDLAVKVSADGASYTTALTVAAASGQVSLAKPVILSGQSADPVAPADGTIWHNGSTGQLCAQIDGRVKVLDSQQDLPFLLPPVGEYVMTTTGCGGASLASALAGAAGRIEIFPFVPRANLVVDRMAFNVTVAAAGALGRILLYDADANGRPASLLVETGDMDCGTTGVKETAVALTLTRGRSYWVGVRHSATFTLSAWLAAMSPDINGGTAPNLNARKVLRRTLAFGTAAPASWGFTSAEIMAGALAPAVWLRMA